MDNRTTTDRARPARKRLATRVEQKPKTPLVGWQRSRAFIRHEAFARLSTISLRVWLVLNDHADFNNAQAWPSMATIAKLACGNKKYRQRARQALNNLVADNLVIRLSIGGPGRSSRYLVGPFQEDVEANRTNLGMNQHGTEFDSHTSGGGTKFRPYVGLRKGPTTGTEKRPPNHSSERSDKTNDYGSGFSSARFGQEDQDFDEDEDIDVADVLSRYTTDRLAPLRRALTQFGVAAKQIDPLLAKVLFDEDIKFARNLITMLHRRFNDRRGEAIRNKGAYAANFLRSFDDFESHRVLYARYFPKKRGTQRA